MDVMKDNGFTVKMARSRLYSAQTITAGDYADIIALPANILTQAKSLLHCLEQVFGGICLHENADKTEYMCFNKKNGDFSTLNIGCHKLADKFTYLGSSVPSTENVINMHLAKTWAVINRLSIIWKSNFSDKIKHIFFLQAVVSILLNWYTTWTLIKRIEKKTRPELHQNATNNIEQILEATLNKTAAVELPSSHLCDHPNMANKTCGTLLEK